MKRLSALACIIFIFLLLGSCGMGSDGTKTARDAVSEDAAPLAVSSPAGSGEASEAVSVPEKTGPEIKIRVNLSPEEEDAMQMLAEDFNASNGRGIRVVVQNEPEQEETEQGETEQEETDTTADILLGDVETVRKTKGLQSLNERYAAEYGNDPDVPQSLRLASEVGGERFGVPFDLDGGVFFYNASLFETYELAPPETWDALLQAAGVLMEEEGCPVMVTDSLTDLSDLLLRQTGVSLTEGNRAAFAGSAGEEAFSFLLSMMNDDYLLLADKDTCREKFLEGSCAGYIGTGSGLSAMFRSTPFTIGAVPVPHPEDSDTVCAPCTMRVLALYHGEKDKQDAAWEFVRYLTTPPVSARWAVATGHFPVRGAAYLEPEYVSYMETSVAANASAGARYGYYLPPAYSEDLQYRVREIIGRNMKSNVTGAEIAQILLQEVNDSLSDN